MSLRYSPTFPNEQGIDYMWDGRPRGMGKKEALVWRKYRDKNPEQFEQVWYDVKLPRTGQTVEQIMDVVPNVTKKWASDYRELTMLRIDCIGMRSGVYTVVEVKTLGTEQVIGQIERYNEQAKAQWPSHIWATPLIVIGDWQVRSPIPPIDGNINIIVA